RECDVGELLGRHPDLGPLDTAALFDPAMVDLDAPSCVRDVLGLLLFHLEVVCRVEFNVPVLGDRLEDLHEPVALEMDAPSVRGNIDAIKGDVSALPPVGIDQAIALHPGEPMPAERPDEFEVVECGVPAVEGYEARVEAPLLGRPEH